MAEPTAPGQTSGMTGISEAAGATDSRPETGVVVSRAWGGFTVLDDADDHKVKRLVVHAGHRLSYQRHAHRAEHWFVVSGHGEVTLDGATREVGPSSSVDVAVHVGRVPHAPRLRPSDGAICALVAT